MVSVIIIMLVIMIALLVVAHAYSQGVAEYEKGFYAGQEVMAERILVKASAHPDYNSKDIYEDFII